jgi:dephospho-CoA kinase
MKIIGLTGGIGSGKSTVSELFLKKGIRVIDADIVYKELSKPGRILYNEIVNAFGSDILCTAGTIDFQKLGSLVFRDASKRALLNSVTHPVVMQEILFEANALKNQRLAVIVVPLLFEATFEEFCDKTICVYVDLRTQLSRVMSRDHIDRPMALLKILAQMPMKAKAKKADFVIDNSFTMSETIRQFEDILLEIRRT